jgi:hypothetical protein
MLRAFLFFLGTGLVVAACALYESNAAVTGILTAGALGVILSLAYLFRGTSPVNTFNVLVLVLGTAGLIALGAIALAFLTPIGALLLAAVVTVLAGYVTWRRGDRRRERRILAGLCSECGYDLRESTDCCPECGAGIPEDLARRRRLAARAKSRADGEAGTTPELPHLVNDGDANTDAAPS